MLQVAQEFVSLLDEARFDEAAKLLAEDCQYHYWEGNYQGRDMVINIYRQMHKEAQKAFDELKYSSEVEPVDGETYTLHFTDSVRIDNYWHSLRYDSIVRVKDALIQSIEHKEIPGEQRKFQGFLQRTGKIK